MEILNNNYPELKDYFVPTESKFGATGHSVPSLVEKLGEVFGNKRLIVKFPYHTFNMKGSGKQLAKSICWQRTDWGTFVHVNSYDYMFYDNRPVNKYNFLPIFSESDVYYIKDITKDEGPITINLVKGPSWRTYL